MHGAARANAETSVVLSREPAHRATAVSEIFMSAPAVVNTREGVFTQIAGHSGSGDAHSIIVISSSGAPPGLSFTTNTPTGISPSGLWNGVPAAGTAGTWTIQWHAADQFGATADDTTQLVVAVANRAPQLSQPQAMTVTVGRTAMQVVFATDPDGDPVSFGKSSGPPFMTVSTTGPLTGSILLAPHTTDVGSYFGRVSASDGTAISESDSFSISVSDASGVPTANPGGPYAGLVNVPLGLDGRGSSDPDGDPLIYRWDFGDGTSGVGSAPTHIYLSGGQFRVCLVVTDEGGLSSDPACTTATLHNFFEADCFTQGGDKIIRLTSSKPEWCVQIQPSPAFGAFSMEDVIPSSIRLLYGDAPYARVTGRVGRIRDLNGDGIGDITACFTKEDLRRLLAQVPAGRNSVILNIQGDLASSGALFQGSLQIEVIRTGSALNASVTPNPLNPEGVLSFETARPGPVRVSLFDLGGRLIRAILRSSFLPAGHHDVTVGSAAGKRELPSGVYFYRIETSEGNAAGRFVVLK